MLTDKELEVIEVVAEVGVRSGAIYFDLAESTIRKYLRRGLKKLNANSVEEAIESIQVLREEGGQGLPESDVVGHLQRGEVL